jgi:hypothetical protein
MYLNEIIRRWRPTTCNSIPINRTLKLDTLPIAEDQVISANSEDELQCSMYNLKSTAKDLKMKLSTGKTKIMAFQGKYPICSKIVI